MKKYTVKNPFYLRGIVQGSGNVVELTEDEYERLLPKDVIGKEVAEATTPDDGEIEGLIYHGGGYYELSNGDKVRGKENALEALEKLKAGGDPNAQNQAGDSANGGTGDAGSNQGSAED